MVWRSNSLSMQQSSICRLANGHVNTKTDVEQNHNPLVEDLTPVPRFEQHRAAYEDAANTRFEHRDLSEATIFRSAANPASQFDARSTQSHTYHPKSRRQRLDVIEKF